MNIKEDELNWENEELNQIYPQINTKIVSVTPYSHIINDYSILDQKIDAIDYNIVREHFLNQGKLSKKQANKILIDSTKILKEETNVVTINDDVYVIGDIHGKFYDLVEILSNFDLKKDLVVFLGNYINRGNFSTEVYLYLSLLKIHFPKNIILLRGNHESKIMAENFGFYHDCIHKYNDVTYNLFLDSFVSLPLACIAKDNLFCVHSGLSPKIKTIEDIQKIDRVQGNPFIGELNDLLWSDPHPLFGEDVEIEDFMYNNNRCTSFFYSLNAVDTFLKENNLHILVRGHEVYKEGYKMYEVQESERSLVTIFSAPNLCGTYSNKGCFLHYNGSKTEFKTFDANPEPFRLKNNLDGFNLTFPYVSQKIGEFYFELLNNIDIKLDDTSDAKRISLEKEMRKARSFIVANTLVRIERENLSEHETKDETTVTNYIKILSDVNDFEKSKSMDEQNQLLFTKVPKKTGISIDKIPSLKPNLVSDIEEVSIDAVFHKSEMNFDDKKDSISVKNIVTSSDGGMFGWCLK